MLEEINDNNDNSQMDVLSVPGEVTVSVGTNVMPEDAEALWSMVQQGFVDLNRRSYEKQDMTKEEFMTDINSTDVLKFISRDSLNTLTGCMTVHVGLKDIPWVENGWCSGEQSRVDPTATSYYIGTLVVPVDLRGTQASTRLLQGALLHFKALNAETNTDSLCFFDCADANDPWLAEFARRCAAPTEDFQGLPIDIYELGEEWWVKQPDGTVQKVANPEERSTVDPTDVLDKQHFYALRLKDE